MGVIGAIFICLRYLLLIHSSRKFVGNQCTIEIPICYNGMITTTKMHSLLIIDYFSTHQSMQLGLFTIDGICIANYVAKFNLLKSFYLILPPAIWDDKRSSDV